MDEMMENLNVNDDAINEYSDSKLSDNKSTTSEKSESSEKKSQYVVLSSSEIVQHMSDIVEKANSVLQLPSSTARMLLNHFIWDKDELLKKFFGDDQDQLFREANVINPFKQIWSTAEDEKCNICYLVNAPAHMKGLGCGHTFCEVCWNQYLTKKIVDEGVGQTITCPAFECPSLVDYETVMRLVEDAKVKIKYQLFITNGFIESNRLTRWCPSPDCEYAIKMESIEFVPVVCKCGHTFCFWCGEDWHDPISCTMLKKWIKKCNDDFEMSIWLSENTKECPSCKTAIEKNGGCNHMICKKENCKAEFCWVCLGPWASHGGDFYNCHRYDKEEAKAARKAQEESRAELNRYTFFCDQYMKQKRRLKLDHTLYLSVTDKMEKMMRELSLTRLDVQCLVDAPDILRKSRRTLMYTYVFAYFSNKNNQYVISEDEHITLEKAMELVRQSLDFLSQSLDHFAHHHYNDFITIKCLLMSVRRAVRDWYIYCEMIWTTLLKHLNAQRIQETFMVGGGK